MVRFSMVSNEGNRENNEDSIGMYQKGDSYCFILADGLGGHGKGETASRMAVDAVIERFAIGERGEDFLDSAFFSAQESIIKKQREDRLYMDMKTTLTVLVIERNTIQWAHIGDSRIYFFRNGKIETRTLDHSVPQMLVAVGEIREKEIRNHPDRNRLLRVLGVEMEEMNHQVSEQVERKPGQKFLLCSDGFWELVDEKKMETALRRSSDPETWLHNIEQTVQKNGKNTDMDNYSAIAVWIED